MKTGSFAVGTNMDTAAQCVIPFCVNEDQFPIFAVHTLSPPPVVGDPDDTAPRVVLAVFLSGKIVWSKNQFVGGPPYMAGTIGQDRANQMASKIVDWGILDDPHLRQPQFGPDSSYTCLSVCIPGREPFQMCSWHEWEDAYSRRAGREKGDQSSGPQVSPSEQSYRAAWNRIKKLVFEAKPQTISVEAGIQFQLRKYKHVDIRVSPQGAGNRGTSQHSYDEITDP